VTRIIAGAVGGRRIAVPLKGTRPTTDRVREAIFGKLDAEGVLPGARVLDAFAGSGALGMEALSRGARHATFVDNSVAAVKVIGANLRDLGLEGVASVVRSNVLDRLLSQGEPFDVALLDPPYDLTTRRLTAVLSALERRLAPNARVVLEWSSRGVAPEWPAGIIPDEVRSYGETSVHYAHIPPSATLDGGSLGP
jgi:16S rRNA (guanine966-N2)-methyltransferase